MKFGVFYEWTNPELRDWQRLFEEGLEQIGVSVEASRGRLMAGATEHDKIIKSIRLMGECVIPALRDAQASAGFLETPETQRAALRPSRPLGMRLSC